MASPRGLVVSSLRESSEASKAALNDEASRSKALTASLFSHDGSPPSTLAVMLVELLHASHYLQLPSLLRATAQVLAPIFAGQIFSSPSLLP
jgi:hypothetical protein